MKKIVASLCFVAVLSAPISLSSAEGAVAQESNWSKVGAGLKTYALPIVGGVALMYFASWAYLISHELGHAYMGKFLYGNPVDVHLGRKSTDTSDAKPLFTIGGGKDEKGKDKDRVCVYSLIPLYGYAVRRITPEVTKAKDSACIAAGGVAGALQGLIFLLILSAYSSFKNNKGAKDICLGGLKNTFFPFSNAKNANKEEFGQLIYGAVTAGLITTQFAVLEQSLLPNNPLTGTANADGTKLWKTNGFTDEELQKIGWAEFALEIVTITSIMGYWLWRTVKDAKAANAEEEDFAV